MDGHLMGMATALLGLVYGAPWRPQGQVPAISVAATRFYRPGDGSTVFEVLAEVRLRAVTSAVAHEGAARYRVEIAVRDSAGTVLTSGGLDREVPAALARVPGATATESFRFAAAPGTYTVQLRAVPEGGQASAIEQQLVVRAFSARPRLSDLVLATEVRPADTGAVAPGVIRRAGLAMRSAPIPRLVLDSARIAYYLEVYPWPGAASDAELVAEVVGAGGRRMVRTPPRQVRFESAGGVARGSLDLTGLPEGRYALRLAVRLGDSTLTAEAPFEVIPQSAPAEVRAAAPEDEFEAMSEAALDSLYGPTEYLLEDAERGVFMSLSLAGKRRFMREAWRRRDPTPGMPDNAALTEFLRTVAYVNAAFRESGSAAMAGWRTDRGRVYLRNGRPDDLLRRPSASPRPYEVWKYMRGRMRYYIFYDRSGLSNYELIGSNDVREPSTNWETRLGRQNALDVTDFIR